MMAAPAPGYDLGNNRYSIAPGMMSVVYPFALVRAFDDVHIEPEAAAGRFEKSAAFVACNSCGTIRLCEPNAIAYREILNEFSPHLSLQVGAGIILTPAPGGTRYDHRTPYMGADG